MPSSSLCRRGARSCCSRQRSCGLATLQSPRWREGQTQEQEGQAARSGRSCFGSWCVPRFGTEHAFERAPGPKSLNVRPGFEDSGRLSAAIVLVDNRVRAARLGPASRATLPAWPHFCLRFGWGCWTSKATVRARAPRKSASIFRRWPIGAVLEPPGVDRACTCHRAWDS